MLLHAKYKKSWTFATIFNVKPPKSKPLPEMFFWLRPWTRRYEGRLFHVIRPTAENALSSSLWCAWHVCIYVCMYVCMYMSMYVYMHACMYVCMYDVKFKKTYVYMWISSINLAKSQCAMQYKSLKRYAEKRNFCTHICPVFQ